MSIRLWYSTSNIIGNMGIMLTPNEIIITREIKLRRYLATDAPDLARQFGHPKILKPVTGRVWRYTQRDANKYIRRKLSQYRRRWPTAVENDIDALGYAITKKDKLIGGIGLTLFGKKAEIGYWLGVDYWDQGIMTKVIKNFVQHLKIKYKVTRVEAKVFSFNPVSGRVLIKAGFKREALIIRDAKIGRRYFDHILYGRKA